MKRRPRGRLRGAFGLVLAFAVVAVGGEVVAAPRVAEWQKELTAPERGRWRALPSSTLEMQLSWRGIVQAGRLRIDFAPRDVKKPGSYVIRSSAGSIGAAARMFPYDSWFWSELDAKSLQPKFFQATESNRKRDLTSTTRHFADRVEYREVATPKRQRGAIQHQAETVFRFAPVFDMFSAMLHVRSREMAAGETVNLVVMPGRTPYLVRVTVVGRERHLGRDAIKLRIGMRRIDRKTLELRPYSKMRSEATLWLSDDANRIPLELRAPVFIGDVRATLVRFERS